MLAFGNSPITKENCAPPETEQQGIFRQIRRRIVWFTIPTFVTLAIEILGGWRFGKDMYSGKYAIDLGPLYDPLVWFVVAAVTLAPILSSRFCDGIFQVGHTTTAQRLADSIAASASNFFSAQYV